MTDREKLIELFVESAAMDYKDSADYFLENGVRLETEQATSNESKQIEELKAQLAEREKVVIQLRKQW